MTIPCYAKEIALSCHASGDTLEQLDGTITSVDALGDLTKIEIVAADGRKFTTETHTSPTDKDIIIDDAALWKFHIKKQILDWTPGNSTLLWKFTFATVGTVTMYYTNFVITD